MSTRSFFIIFIVVTVMIILAGAFVFSTSSQNAPQVHKTSLAKAYVSDPTSYDWGKIDYSGPKATKSFTIKNNGKETLQLFNLRTSCHCTKTYLTINGQDSPEFGMDMSGGASSYVGNVAPGKEAKLTVVFDQSFHGPEGVGPITRFVEVQTNDSGNPKITFTLTGTVVKK